MLTAAAACGACCCLQDELDVLLLVSILLAVAKGCQHLADDLGYALFGLHWAGIAAAVQPTRDNLLQVLHLLNVGITNLGEVRPVDEDGMATGTCKGEIGW